MLHTNSVLRRLRNSKSQSLRDESPHHRNRALDLDDAYARIRVQLNPFLDRVYHQYKQRPTLFKLLLLLLTFIIYLCWPGKHKRSKSKASLQYILSRLSYTEVTELHRSIDITPFPSRSDFLHYDSPQYSPQFPIDIIYSYGGQQEDFADPRTRDNAELKYSLRSIHAYLPWINRIFLIVPDTLAINLAQSPLFPSWLDGTKLTQHKIQFIAQSSIFHNIENGKDNRNSNAFEMNMHRIPGLSEHFIYMNDDFFIGRPLPYTFFFNEEFVPRWPYNHFMKYYWMDRREKRRTKYANCYNYDVEELIDKPVPQRVDYYRTHSPRPLTKSLMHKFVDEMYFDFFMFMESHKSRWCSSPTVWHTIKTKDWKYWKQLIKLRLKGENWYTTNLCAHEETLFLSLFKAYVDGTDIIVDVMADPPDENIPSNYYIYGIPIEQKCADILWFRPYTFNINDDYDHTDKNEYNRQITILHQFFERYFPKPAPWEV